MRLLTGGNQCTVTLVSAGAEVNEPDQTGCTPLHYSAASQAFSRVDRHFSANHQNDEDEAKESYFCLEHLLDNGADPSMVNSKGYSAVHYAAYHGNKQNLELLLEMSFNALGDIESSIPVSPLHLAADKGHWQALRVLTRRQPSCLLNDTQLMWTPIHVAASNGHSDCLRMMIDYGEEGDLTNVADKFWNPSDARRPGGHTDCVHFLLEKGALPDAKDKRGSTLCTEVVFIRRLHAIHKASSVCRDVQGRTPLHYASSRGHTEILAALVQAAMATDTQNDLLDDKQYTPLHWAAYKGMKTVWRMNGHSGAAERLLETAGVHMINTRDAKRKDPPACGLRLLRTWQASSWCSVTAQRSRCGRQRLLRPDGGGRQGAQRHRGDPPPSGQG
ncbi:hypothetical protein KUCAC02_020412 [Chaenocephalus aceratus]|nr:hypothetical protein KUCAC02_020412 [Chaenocephalus aceratus]